MAKFDVISVENPVFREYCFWAVVLVLKMMAMSILTGMKRASTKV